jgi:hypothetical protein
MFIGIFTALFVWFTLIYACVTGLCFNVCCVHLTLFYLVNGKLAWWWVLTCW